MFHSEPQRGSSSAASSVGQASPPHRILGAGSPCHPASSSSRHVGRRRLHDGRALPASARRAKPVDDNVAGAMTTCAPATSGRKISRPAMSNDSDGDRKQRVLSRDPGLALHRGEEIGQRPMRGSALPSAGLSILRCTSHRRGRPAAPYRRAAYALTSAGWSGSASRHRLSMVGEMNRSRRLCWVSSTSGRASSRIKASLSLG